MNTIFTVAALIGGTVLVFQFVLMLLGLGEHGGDVAGGDIGHAPMGGDVGGHFDHAGGDLTGGEVTSDHGAWHEAADVDLGHPDATWFFEMLSLRTLSAATTFFGLAGKTALAYGYSPLQAIVVAGVAGGAALYGVYWLFKQVYRLQNSGNENVRNAIGAPATVYVPIAGKRAGTGKVTFRMQNRLVEYLAVTDDDERLRTGEKVVVVAVVNSETVCVTRDQDAAPEAPTSATNVTSSA
jgi:hypothetical protein